MDDGVEKFKVIARMTNRHGEAGDDISIQELEL